MMETWKILIIVWALIMALAVALGLFCRRRTWVGFGGRTLSGGRGEHHAGGTAWTTGGGGGDYGGGGGGGACGGGGGAGAGSAC